VQEGDGSPLSAGVLEATQISALNLQGVGAGADAANPRLENPVSVDVLMRGTQVGDGVLRPGVGAGATANAANPWPQNHVGADVLLSGAQVGEGVEPGENSDLGKFAAEQEEGAVEVVPSGDDSSQTDSMDTNELEMALKEWGDEEEISKHPSIEEMAAIPEASSEQSAARRSKRRVGEVDEEVGVSAEHRKAFRNEGMSPVPTSLSLVNDSLVIANLNAIGISLGEDGASIRVSMDNIKEKASGRVQELDPLSIKEKVLEKEEELLEEEELEKLF
jgi:hypothetical protein